MVEMLSKLVYWHWWILALGCMGVEMLLPGAAFIWLGVAAGLVGLATYVLPGLSWEVQVLGFSVLSIISVLVWFVYLRRSPIATDQPNLNERGEYYVGKTYTLSQPIVNGRGRIRIGDTSWAVEGPDLPEGTIVCVLEVKNTILVVQKV